MAPRGDRESHRTLQGARLRLSRLRVCAVDGARAAGLLVSTEGSTVLLLPSLAIDKRIAARGLNILARSI
jgi:4-aminobutyrate aminotransferase-like enzyme